MVEAVLRGLARHKVARRFHVAWNTVSRWVARAGDQPLSLVNWENRPPVPLHTGRTAPEIEDTVLDLRRELRCQSDLGEFGSSAIHRALLASRRFDVIPSVRTIGYILERRGALDSRHRVRRPAPPLGWYLPALANRLAEADSFDFVEGLVIKGGPHIEVFNGVSLHGGLPCSWPTVESEATAVAVTQHLLEHWRAYGRPTYAQFDNDTRFHGPHQNPDGLGRVTRFCLALGVIPVFVPPNEPGFQAAVESYNGRWQAKVWARFHHDDIAQLGHRSRRYVAAVRLHRAPRIDAAPARRPIPRRWRPDLQSVHGRVIFLRRTSDRGSVAILGRTFAVDPHWTNRLVRAELHLDEHRLLFFALRRRDPSSQPLLSQIAYALPRRPFRE